MYTIHCEKKLSMQNLAQHAFMWAGSFTPRAFLILLSITLLTTQSPTHFISFATLATSVSRSAGITC
jgi:hypothetical protein